MREILFRGKRIDNGEWVYGLLCRVGDTYANIVEKSTEVMCTVLTNTIGQSTGLTDKNGKKIFEGDIVHFRTSGLSGYGEVKDENGRFVIVDKRKKPTRYYPFYDDAIYRVDGNIHDNPELLEETE